MTTGKTIKVDGSCRNDTFIYNMSGNGGRAYDYDGDGGTDTLQLEFTRAQWMSTGVQADIARLRDYFARGCLSRDFTFSSFKLTIEDIEKARIIVDGVEVSLVDNAVCARDDAFGVRQDGRIAGSVLGNDSVLDLVRGVSLVSGPSAGTLELKADGTFTYATGDAFDWLGAGQTTTVCFTYRVTDADGDTGTATVVLTVTGTNDVAVIGLPTVTQVTEDQNVASGKLTARGSIAISDVDRGEAGFRTNVSAESGTLGVLTLAANGTYAYSVDNSAVQYLAAGQTKTETFTITALDGTQKSIAFTITGTNDAPTITSGAQAGSVTEDVSATATGTIAFTDVDLSDGHTATFTAPSGALGTFALGSVSEAANAASGTVGWNYTLDNAKAQFLGAGETRVESYVVTVADGKGGTVQQTVAVTITGTNDAAIIGTPLQNVVVEDQAVNPAGKLVAAGTLAISDVDQGQARFAGFDAAAGNLGTLVLGADGVYAYSVDNAAVQYLGEGKTRVDTFTVRSVDGTTKDIAFTIQGANDAPVARDDHFTVADTGTVSLAVLANDSDIDGDDLTLSIVNQPLEGTILLDTSGHFVFDPGATFASLSAGQSAEVGFDYRISDGHGGTSVAHATILVEGVGQFVSPLQTDKSTATVNHQPVSVSLTAPQQTGTLNNHVEVAIDLGAGNANKKNVFFVVDISGSTSLKFAGTPVGDLNGRDGANTILDAEIAGLLKLNAQISALGYSPDDVTITVVPFNSKANPADWVSSKATPNIETKTFDLGSASIDAFLKTLDAGGGTNYEEALQGVIEKLRVLDPTGAEGNIVYFLSDGEPNPVNTFGDEIATLNTQYHALMSAIGVGASVPLQYLDMIDNTGGAERVTSTDQLSAALLGAPFPTNHVVDFDLFVNGTQLTDIDINDLVAVGTGFKLNLDIDHLNALFGQNNSVVAAIELQDGTHLSVDLDISGVLPQTTVDFII